MIEELDDFSTRIDIINKINLLIYFINKTIGEEK